jgi:cyclophilin family peptidyl-prolyl cis-trans isomerase
MDVVDKIKRGAGGNGEVSDPDRMLKVRIAATNKKHYSKKGPDMVEITDKENTIIMETTKGKVVIELLPDVAPQHVARIKELAREGAYDGVVFHRVIDGFMAQGGDPTTRAPAWAVRRSRT